LLFVATVNFVHSLVSGMIIPKSRVTSKLS